MRARRWLVSSSGVALLFACSRAPSASAAEVLRLSQVRPQNASGVYLNEELVFHFSAELDPASVHRRSLRIAALDGASPRGDLRVEGDQVRFIPAPVLASTLDDGGYRPDTEYTVEFVGFPRPDGLRALSGAPLERSWLWSFHTVSVREPRNGPVFEDHSPESGASLLVSTANAIHIHPAEPIAIEGGEPIDPSTLHAEDFELRPVKSTPDRKGGVLDAAIPLRARLTDNRDPRDLALGGRTRIELVPQRVLSPGAYALFPAPTLAARLRDFGGHPVWPFSLRRIDVRVEGATSAPQSQSYCESFVDTRMRSAAEVPQADGTAWWSSTGKLEIRFPAAAADAQDGDVRLSGDELRNEIHGARLTVESGESASLDADGPVILSAAARVTIAGTLERFCAHGASRERTQDSVSAWAQKQFEGARDLSAWLDQLRAHAHDADPLTSTSSWTVIIAGGDLTISGRLRVHGPLFLVAGGRVRVSGELEFADPTVVEAGHGESNSPLLMRQEFPTCEDGVLALIPVVDAKDGRKPWVFPKSPCVIDRVGRNPVRGSERLVFQVYSSPIPPSGGVGRWRGALVNGFAGAPARSPSPADRAYSVRYVAEPSDSAQPIVVDDPALLVGAKSLRLLIELDLLATDNDRWDPPWVDDVTVFWDSPANEVGH